MAIDLKKMFEQKMFEHRDRREREARPPPVLRIINTLPHHFWTREAVSTGRIDSTVPHESNVPKERELPTTREVLHVNALRRIPGEWVDAPLRAPRHKRKRWMSDAYHSRIQKKWDKQAKGKTMKVPPTEHVILSLSKIAVHKIQRAAILSRANHGKATAEDLTIPADGKFPPLRVVVDPKDMSVGFSTRDQEITATAEDLNAAEWVTLTLRK